MAEGKYTRENVEITEEQLKARRARNVAIGLVLAAFVAIMYFVTWTKLGINIFNREL
ncbi:MAG: hypothetical protein JJ891_06170 [Rhizobiaceae bacterium]|jgi:hypothetical protein|nr:hypothetical protein [Rhizobiaceae bacterium]